jgi:hypothetical protein
MGLLGSDDITSDAGSGAPILRSLLNASLLDEIKRQAIEPSENNNNARVGVAVPFLAER